MDAYHTIETPRAAPGAIAMIRVVHDDVASLGLIDPAVGTVRLGKLFDIDEGVIVRWDADSIVLMPHGGIAILQALSKALAERSVAHRDVVDPVAMYPEAHSEIEAWMLYALSQASSPLAIDVLLDQPERWKALGVERIKDVARVNDVADGDVLGRLIEAPIVAAVGRANVGKSTLINALAGEHVAIVADIAGTTRDHVGVLVDLGGLVVRWIDTPGIDERVGDGEEIEIAMRVVSQASLIVHCIDSKDDQGVLDERVESAIGSGVARIRVGTRADLGEHECELDGTVLMGGDGQFSGIEALVERIREALVPKGVLSESRPWRFWDGLAAQATR